MNDPVVFSNNCNTVSHAEQYLSKYKPLFKWTDSEDILEIGCSTGVVTKEVLYPFVQEKLHHLIATDVFEPAIKAAKETNDVSKLSFQVMDIMDESECDKCIEKFNHIFAFYLFHVLRKPDLCSKNVYNMLRPNGQLFALIALSSNLVTWTMAAQKEDKSKPWSKYIEDLPGLFYDFGSKPTETIRKLFTDVGFVVNALDLQTVTFIFSDFQRLKNTATGGNAFLGHVPKELQERYMQDYMDRLFQYVTCEQDGKYSFRLDIVTVVVTKI